MLLTYYVNFGLWHRRTAVRLSSVCLLLHININISIYIAHPYNRTEGALGSVGTMEKSSVSDRMQTLVVSSEDKTAVGSTPVVQQWRMLDL